MFFFIKKLDVVVFDIKGMPRAFHQPSRWDERGSPTAMGSCYTYTYSLTLSGKLVTSVCNGLLIDVMTDNCAGLPMRDSETE